jgi:DNA mismatch repair ATPase MutS
MIISGPNASGKSTLLKTTLLNVLLSQQIGFGFYSKAKITIFDYLHCYLNIPDTSGRDSLFQSEARRCIEILDSINTNNSRHLCVFDELYSGTNPYEAISAATAYLQYMNKYPNIKYVLTTHYLELCKNLDKNKKIINYNMEIVENSNDFIYTYKLLKGISRVKGGIKVLKDLNYPEEIIHNTKKIMKNIIIN